jgi:hypothetical protein
MSEQQPLPLTGGPRISRLTLARLFNLGNFEHMRYEVTVDLPAGTSPASVLRELESAIADLEPKEPVTHYERLQALKVLQGPEPTLASVRVEMDSDPFGDDDYSPEQLLERKQLERARAQKTIERYDDWLRSREGALQRLEALGGVGGARTDAKVHWGDDA